MRCVGQEGRQGYFPVGEEDTLLREILVLVATCCVWVVSLKHRK